MELTGITEAEVQFELAMACRNAGYDVYLERNFFLPNFKKTIRKKQQSRLRVDVVVVKNGEVVLLVEVKRSSKTRNRSYTRQHKKYNSLGLPWCYCYGVEDIPTVIKKLC